MPGGGGALQFGQDGLGEFFAVFHAPLVEGVDAPHGALHEDFVFVHGENQAEGVGRDAFDEDGVTGAVAGEAALAGKGGLFAFR